MTRNAKSIAEWTGAIVWLFIRGWLELTAAFLLLWGGLWALKYPWPDNDWVLYGCWILIYFIIDFIIFTLPLLMKKTERRCR